MGSDTTRLAWGNREMEVMAVGPFGVELPGVCHRNYIGKSQILIAHYTEPAGTRIQNKKI